MCMATDNVHFWCCFDAVWGNFHIVPLTSLMSIRASVCLLSWYMWSPTNPNIHIPTLFNSTNTEHHMVALKIENYSRLIDMSWIMNQWMILCQCWYIHVHVYIVSNCQTILIHTDSSLLFSDSLSLSLPLSPFLLSPL